MNGFYLENVYREFIFIESVMKLNFTAVKFHYRVLQLTAVFSDNLTPLGVTIILLAIVPHSFIYIYIYEFIRVVFQYKYIFFTLFMRPINSCEKSFQYANLGAN